MPDRLTNASAMLRVLHKDDAGRAHEMLMYAETAPLRPLVVQLSEAEVDGGKVLLIASNGFRMQRKVLPPLAPGMQSTIELWLLRKRAELEATAAEMTSNGATSITIDGDGHVG